MPNTPDLYERMVVNSPFGWVSLIGADRVLFSMSFGLRSESAANRWFSGTRDARCVAAAWNKPLADRIVAYFSGERIDFSDVSHVPQATTDFQKAVLHECSAIGFGHTMTYAQLSALAGSPGGSRAVGNCMAKNRIPIIVPCHRVVASNGGLGGYSAAGGVDTKRRLLELESGAHQ